MLTVGAGVTSAAVSVIGTMSNDIQDGKESDELSVLEFSDYLPLLKRAALSSLEFSHNGTFSNGQVNGNSVGTVSKIP